jgi:hypothetical protein
VGGGGDRGGDGRMCGEDRSVEAGGVQHGDKFKGATRVEEILD